MSRYIIIALLALSIPCLVYADALYPPPAHGAYGAGWGMNPTNWSETSGSFYAWGLYDPLHDPQGGDAWVVGWDPVTYIDYADITLELWIEMYSMQTYHYTSYQWHRLGDAEETINFCIEGLIQSNNGQYISLMYAGEDLNYLHFVEDIFGRTGPDYGTDIPIVWDAAYGTGDVYGTNILWEGFSLQFGPEDDVTIGPIPACDHWFQFCGEFYLPYHIDDGYYSLLMGGCPAPEM
jgi:hypothetical protein